jgi:hypothetical protein
MNPMEQYYLDRSFKGDVENKWNYLLDLAFQKADQVEFNVLFPRELSHAIEPVKHYQIKSLPTQNKIYKSGKTIRFNLTEDVKRFIASKPYFDWRNFVIEDISFLKQNVEFLATITHENYIIIKLNRDVYCTLNALGFELEPFENQSDDL